MSNRWTISKIENLIKTISLSFVFLEIICHFKNVPAKPSTIKSSCCLFVRSLRKMKRRSTFGHFLRELYTSSMYSYKYKELESFERSYKNKYLFYKLYINQVIKIYNVQKFLKKHYDYVTKFLEKYFTIVLLT